MERLSAGNRIFIGLIALTGWFAISVQFYLMLHNRVTSVSEMIVRFFSFFTILTNILVAITASALFIKRSGIPGFLQRPNTLTASAVYIFIVGLIYNLILRHIWDPKGMQRLVDELLHLIIPVLFIIYWFLFVSKHELKWSNLWGWLLYPFIYIVYVLVRGAFSGFYPYPFVDVNLHGYRQVAINSILITLLFIFFSLLFIGIGKRIATSKK